RALHPFPTRRSSDLGVDVPRALAGVMHELRALADAVPRPRVELDQCHCTVETKVRRVLAMYEAGALGGRRVLMLGDDDLTSVARSEEHTSELQSLAY